ncbi:MAG: hypothetical protein V5A48_09075 [Salinivenus sp.]
MSRPGSRLSMHLEEFKKEAPTDFSVCRRPGQGCYKYCLRGKGCTLGVLFETSTCVCFEWLEENGQAVDYRPELRYKAWPKREVTRLVAEGWWEPTPTDDKAAA